MTIADWLVDSMVKLQKADVPNGRTDALVLLADMFGTDKSWVHGHPEHEIDGLQERELEYKLNKRMNRVPLAYIRGFSEFYGRKFTVNSNVLVPRPESGSFIDLLAELSFEAPCIADIGTGSGCLGIIAALEIPDATVDLYDIDPSVLAVANHNASQYGLDLGIYESDLLTMLKHKYDIMLANLPYVPDQVVTSPEILKEPSAALFSGPDGLSHYRRFWEEIRELTAKPKFVLTESLENQHLNVTDLAASAGYKLVKTSVLVQLFKQA